MLISDSAEWKHLETLAQRIKSTPLSTLLDDPVRNESLLKSFGVGVDNSIMLDLSRSQIDESVISGFSALFDKIGLHAKIRDMYSGVKINQTENRSVLHTALRAPHSSLSVHSDILKVLKSIETFSDEIRSGKRLGYSGKPLTSVVCIGIGGSYLGPEFVFEALRSDYRLVVPGVRTTRFLANVDPVDVGRALEGLDPETTLVIIISKTFTTAETMLNAETVKQWILTHYKKPATEMKQITDSHFCAVSTALEKTAAFGISTVFGFWDWVGGRFSVCSAVGMLPLALHFGFSTCRSFLDGAHMVDEHFLKEQNYAKNVPILLGMLSVWNSTFLGYGSNAILPYAQSLVRFVAHVQQVDMESNGKRVDMNGQLLPFSTGQVIFGEPGTNGQHSFYQLLHQGTNRISCDFIGFKKSTNPIVIPGEPVSNHDELMSNFFAQPDALAFGKHDAGGHKNFPGDRPSLSLLLPVGDAFNIGVLLALYEHRTAVQSFIWNTNAFDQWGVELGKVLAKSVRNVLAEKKLPSDPKKNNLLLKTYMS